MICNIAIHYCAIALRNIYLYLLIDLRKFYLWENLVTKLTKVARLGKFK